MARRLILAAAVAAVLLVPAPAFAGGSVSVDPGTVDPTYATTISVSGSGFQAVKGGHGGVYVFFGTVSSGWQPSKGGVTGKDYFYVPDSEAKNNQGFQRYVAFPGSDTASSANGGVMSASGSWSTQLVVPGAEFKAYDRAGNVRTIDCREVTCGVITVGAHGVANGNNETFTPVSIGTASKPTSTSSATPTATADPSQTADPEAPTAGESAPVSTGPATLEVDRESAVAGNVLAFTASGLPPGVQVSAVFDDGAAGAGPFLVGPDGTLAGVITLPAATGAGTHELRLFGVSDAPSVQFAVVASTVEHPTTEAAASDDELRVAWLFAGAAALVLVVALARLFLRYRGSRRAA
ncbi:hypothetical protein [Nocardioides sp. SR21]|uniref:hypothetical protein n=1 Tax=Nocardioides sp. SR21 TaxID=2919501 RepID=UPI001FAA5D85|nr:hypothetical protein [Nocardioides sp. SR21]